MKRIFLLALGLFLAVSGYTQRTADIGIWGGGSNYMGDLENQTFTTFGLPTLGAYFRYNLHYRTSIRAMFLTGRIAGRGTVQGHEFISQPESEASYEGFSKLFQDFTVQAEINYLRYMTGNSKASFTSYLTAGIGVMHFPYEYDPVFMNMINPRTNKGDAVKKGSVITPTIPFGMGFKFNVGSRMGIGLEYQMRKLFSDKLDNLDDPYAHFNLDNIEVTYRDMYHNNDWAGYLGLHITYKIYMGSKPCPAYDVKN
jgi:hypothetical protein